MLTSDFSDCSNWLNNGGAIGLAFSSCTAPNGFGGAIWISGLWNATISQCRFFHCNAGRGCASIVTNCVFDADAGGRLMAEKI
jgi:hypothetical protein